MNGARHHFLAGSAFAEDQHRMRALCRLSDNAVELFHLRGAADNTAKSLLGLDLFPQHPVFGFELQMRRDPLQQ